MALSFQDKIKPVATPQSGGGLSFADKIQPVSAPVAPAPEKQLSNRIAENLGFGGAVDTLGSLIARAGAKPEEKQYIQKPTKGEVAGTTAQLGSLLYPGTTIAKGATALAGKVLPKAASKVAGSVVATGAGGYGFEAGQKLAEGEATSEALKPGAITAVSAAIPLAVPVTKGLGKLVGKTTKFATSQATGLSPNTIETIISKPHELTAAEKAGLDRISLANDVKGKIDSRIANLSETGKGYEAIKKMTNPVVLPTDVVGDVISKYGLKFSPEGKIIQTAESVPLKSGDIRDLEAFVAQYGGQKVLSPNAFLNARTALTNLSSFGTDKSDIAARIAREIRKGYDAIGKTQIPTLSQLDATYAPEVSILKRIKKDYLTPTGELKDTAINKIANLGGAGKDKVIARLEQVVPDIRQRVQLLKALEDITATEGQKVGSYLRGGVGGAVLSGGNPIITAVSAIVASPAVAVPILKAYGASKGFLGKSIDTIIQKIKTSTPFTSREVGIIKNAVDSHANKFRTPGDIVAEKGKAALGSLVEKQKNIPGKQGGYIANPLAPKKNLGSLVPDQPLIQEARKYKTVEEFVKAQGTPVYHGTNRDFKSFDISRSYSERNKTLGAGDAIYVSPTKELAQKYSNAGSNASFDKQILSEVGQKSKVAESLMNEIYTNGYEKGWKNFVDKNPNGIKLLEKQGINPNDIGDVADLIRGSKSGVPSGIADQMFQMFQQNGYKEIPTSIIEKAKNIGVKSIPTSPKVVDANIIPSAKIKKLGSIKNTIEEANIAKKEGYDGISFINANGSLEREIAIFNPQVLKTRSQLTDIWKKAVTN